MIGDSFSKKWSQIEEGDTQKDNTEEKSIFVDVGDLPVTQRQFNLYHYFEFIQSVLEKKKSKKVLEIGCGRGTIGLYVSKHMGLDVSLLDNVPEALELAKKEFEKHGQSAEYYVEDVLKTKFQDNSFDAVVSIGLAEHFEEVDDLFKEQFRILKPGGIMVSLNIPKKTSIQYLNVIMRSFKKLFGKYKESVRKDYYRNTLRAGDYKFSAERAGFSNVYTFPTFPFPFFIPIKMSTDKKLTKFFLFIIKIRRIFQRYPYKTNRFVAQSHFLVGEK